MPTEVGILESMYHKRSENLPFNSIAGAEGRMAKKIQGQSASVGQADVVQQYSGSGALKNNRAWGFIAPGLLCAIRYWLWFGRVQKAGSLYIAKVICSMFNIIECVKI